MKLGTDVEYLFVNSRVRLSDRRGDIVSWAVDREVSAQGSAMEVVIEVFQPTQTR